MFKHLLSTGHYMFQTIGPLHEVYENISNSYNKDSKVEVGSVKIKLDKDKNIHRIYNIPDFLVPKTPTNLDYNKFDSTESETGFLIDLENHKSTEEFLANQFSSRQRKKIRAGIKKLENCFNISYKFYYGEISKDIYDNLFETIKFFLQERFLQLNKENQFLNEIALFKETNYQLILEKRASIFVIYDDNKPINICLNHHLDNITFNTLSSFDINYSKFRLGYIDIIKQLEWCFYNNFRIYDLGMGELPFKKEWSNNLYEFKHHIFFKKHSIHNRIIAKTLRNYRSLRKKILDYKYSKKNNLIKAIININKKESVTKTNYYNKHTFEISNIENFDSNNSQYFKIDIENKLYAFLKKPLFDFLYSNKETKNDTQVYKSKENDATFIFKGIHKQQEIKQV